MLIRQLLETASEGLESHDGHISDEDRWADIVAQNGVLQIYGFGAGGASRTGKGTQWLKELKARFGRVAVTVHGVGTLEESPDSLAFWVEMRRRGLVDELYEDEELLEAAEDRRFIGAVYDNGAIHGKEISPQDWPNIEHHSGYIPYSWRARWRCRDNVVRWTRETPERDDLFSVENWLHRKGITVEKHVDFFGEELK